MCKFGKQSDLRKLIQQAAAIIWDEAPMTNRRAFETVDRTFQDMLDICRPFGGKVLILGGDFRQLTPVVVNGAKSEIIKSSIVESHLWNNVCVLRLSSNMRAKDDTYFSSFVLRVGEGTEPTMDTDMIRVPNSMIIPWDGDISISKLVNFVFPDLSSNFDNVDYMKCRAIITPLNEDVYKLNEMTLALFPGEEHTYYSFDSVLDDTRNLYLPEFLNSLSPGSLPPHKLTVKVGSPIMLLRNIDPNIGLCNGTRLLCRRFGKNIIEAEILAGQYGGQRVFLPRIPLQTPEDTKMPFKLTRKQFPVRLCFALTINKSQGQTIENVGIYLPENVFSHGQLYVAFSRGVSEQKTKILVRRGALPGLDGVYTKNVVYKEIFAKLNYQLQS